MQIKIKSPATVPAGRYPAVFEGIEEKTSKRDDAPYYRWQFTAHTAEGEKEVSGTSSTNTGPKSKAYAWFAGLLGRKPNPNESIDPGELVGTACVVVLEENEEGYANVVGVLPRLSSRLSDGAAEAYADQAEDLPF